MLRIWKFDYITDYCNIYILLKLLLKRKF